MNSYQTLLFSSPAMAKFPQLRGRGLLVTRLGAKTDFSEVRVYWASTNPDAGILERE
jgi:hypothetical protein